MSGQLHAPASLDLGEEPPDTHWIGGWVEPRAGLDVAKERKIPSAVGHRTPIQLSSRFLPSQYTNWAIQARKLNHIKQLCTETWREEVTWKI
jgi:hypothetical protein